MTSTVEQGSSMGRRVVLAAGVFLFFNGMMSRT
jgi:hypothetical protein